MLKYCHILLKLLNDVKSIRGYSIKFRRFRIERKQFIFSLKLFNIMQNLRKLFILTITLFCANYGSIFAQGKRKAFEEGDKIVTFGISGGSSSSEYSHLTPSLSFDYGLKGTRGIVSVGGLLSYSNSDFYSYYNGFSSSYLMSNPDTITRVTSSYGFGKQHNLTVGLRLGLHYSTRKWDLYAGALIGYRRIIRNAFDFKTDVYKGIPSLTNNKPISSETFTVPTNSFGQMIFSPYVGARYYLTKKISLNVEVGQRTGHAGIGFKF
jgi:hypothetical protein